MFAKPCDFPTSENVHQFFSFLPSVSQSSLKFSFVSEIEIENRFPQLVFLFTRKKNIDEPGEAWKLKVPTKRLMINTWIARGKRRLISFDFHCGKKSQSHDRPPPPSSSPPGQRSPSRASVHVACQWGALALLANGELPKLCKCTCGVAPYLLLPTSNLRPTHTCVFLSRIFSSSIYTRAACPLEWMPTQLYKELLQAEQGRS